VIFDFKKILRNGCAFDLVSKNMDIVANGSKAATTTKHYPTVRVLHLHTVRYDRS